MKIIGINCSPRKGQTTQKGLEVCLEAARKESDDITTAIVELADRDIRGCLDCGYCRNHGQCRQDDDFNALIPILNDETIDRHTGVFGDNDLPMQGLSGPVGVVPAQRFYVPQQSGGCSGGRWGAQRWTGTDHSGGSGRTHVSRYGLRQ